MILRYLFLSGWGMALAGCEPSRDDAGGNPSPPVAESPRRSIVFLGTSLTAGHGIDPEEAYPALIQKKIDAAGLDYQAINAGVSGETSAGALRRVDWLLRQPVSVLVLETGANDGLRGLPPDSLRANIQAILDRVRRLQPSAKLVILGMRVPPNYGRAYSQRFQSVYLDLAKANGATFVPFLLEGVGGLSALNQADGIHPTAQGQRRMAETVWRVLEPVLRRTERRRGRRGRRGSPSKAFRLRVSSLHFVQDRL
jgi:acyl-CoA thioesterase I